MSQHIFKTRHKGHPITVVLGWDRALSYYFMFIRKPAKLVDRTMPTLDPTMLYSNMFEDDPHGHDLDYYRKILRRLKITVPKSMFNEVETDERTSPWGAGRNRIAIHHANGSFTEKG